MAKPLLVVVTGPPGSGKTTLAKLLAAEVHCPFWHRFHGDTDARLDNASQIYQPPELSVPTLHVTTTSGYEPALADIVSFVLDAYGGGETAVSNQIMNLTHNKLKIRNATVADASLLCAWWNDGQVMAHAGFPHGLGISENKIIALLAQDNDQNRRLILEFDDEPIGEMNYRTVAENVAEIGIKICQTSQQNRGLGSTCLQMLLDHLFMTLAYEKVILDTNLKNERAQHVYEKLGFRKVRTNVDAWQDQDGNWQSSVDYEITRKEFLNR